MFNISLQQEKTKLNGSIPLHLLCQCYQNNNLIDLVQLLIGYGADVNAKTSLFPKKILFIYFARTTNTQI